MYWDDMRMWADAPLHVFARFAQKGIDLPGGPRLERGQQIARVLGATNRDPAVFADPDRFDPARSAGAHASFDAPLAGAEMQIALPAPFTVFPDLSHAEAPRFGNSYHFHKHVRLTVAA